MKLVKDGKVAVDEDVNTYLKTWKLLEGKLLVKDNFKILGGEEYNDKP
ncbi:hypothetical protein SDC9_126894 [bioreactor metagenome]|uniref:Uncharacterized protein n=1 Tax=bioreactor metagenome TaxID=1076179 RepID=A0A645CT29_9ZZZZ